MAWIAIMPGVYAGLPDEVQIKAEAETTGDPSSGQTVPLMPFGVAQHAIQTPRLRTAPSLRRSGRSPKEPARPANTSTAELPAVACYVKSTSRQLRIGRRNAYPAAREADICRAAFGVPDTAGIKTYVAPNAWHVWEFTWEQTSSPSLTLGGL